MIPVSMNKIIVCKYGGSSTTSPESLEIKRNITSDDPRRQIIVLSAHGELDGEKKDTDLLTALARTKDMSIIERIMNKARKIYTEIPVQRFRELEDDLVKRLRQELPEAALEDLVKAFGEHMCAKLSSETLGYEYVDPKDLFLVSGDFGRGKIVQKSQEMIRSRLLGRRGPFVVPGFYGFTENENVITLSRGGSDLTGAYLAAALDAGVYENFTDTEGILAASPRIVSNPKKIEEITFAEIRDLAYSGFSIFHEEAMKPLSAKGIPVHVRNTFTYPSQGTFIVSDRISSPEMPIVGVAYKDGFCSFDIDFFGLNDSVGVGRKILEIFERRNTPVEYLTTGIDDMSVIVNISYFSRNSYNASEVLSELRSILGEDANISLQQDLGSLVVAGKGLRGRRGISGEIQSLLADTGVNIRFISQGPLERSIVYGIQSTDGKKAVNALYDRYLK